MVFLEIFYSKFFLLLSPSSKARITSNLLKNGGYAEL